MACKRPDVGQVHMKATGAVWTDGCLAVRRERRQQGCIWFCMVVLRGLGSLLADYPIQMQAACALMVSRRCPAAVAADGKGLS